MIWVLLDLTMTSTRLRVYLKWQDRWAASQIATQHNLAKHNLITAASATGQPLSDPSRCQAGSCPHLLGQNQSRERSLVHHILHFNQEPLKLPIFQDLGCAAVNWMITQSGTGRVQSMWLPR